PYMLNLKLGDGSVKRFFCFQQKFYGAGKDGTKKTFVDALVSEGLGVEVTSLSDAKPGDFVQLWRNNKTGHSGIFQNWITNDKNDIIGIRYFQVSKKTHGIGYCEDI